MERPPFLNRAGAAAYLRERYGFGTEKALARFVTTGAGPAFRKGGNRVLYEPAALDDWVMSQISDPLFPRAA